MLRQHPIENASYSKSVEFFSKTESKWLAAGSVSLGFSALQFRTENCIVLGVNCTRPHQLIVGMNQLSKLAVVIVVVLSPMVANADVVTIASIGERTGAGAFDRPHWEPGHEHSDGGDLAGVGYFLDLEESRGFVEFDITSIADRDSAIFSFIFSEFQGLYYGQDQDYLGDFDIYAYEGTGLPAYIVPGQTGWNLGTFSALGLNYGDQISVDVSATLSALSGDYLKFVFDPTSPNSGEFRQETVFTTFRIEATNVPEPGTLALLGLGLLGMGLSRRKTV